MVLEELYWTVYTNQSDVEDKVDRVFRYRQFGGHKNREIKSLKIDYYIILVDVGSFRSFIQVRLTIQRIGVSPLLDKKLFIYLMQNLVRLPI